MDRVTLLIMTGVHGASEAEAMMAGARQVITQDIIERADVARSTFYVHYVDKDDLLTGGQGIFAENLDHQMTAHTRGGGASAFSARIWFYHVQAQADILKLIEKDPAMELAMKTLRGIIHRSVQEGMELRVQLYGSDPDGDAVTYAWNFGANATPLTSTAQNHARSESGARVTRNATTA